MDARTLAEDIIMRASPFATVDIEIRLPRGAAVRFPVTGISYGGDNGRQCVIYGDATTLAEILAIGRIATPQQ